MDEPHDDFAALMARARAGCPDARRTLHEKYGHAVRRVVRLKLHRKMRAQYDSLDFAQDVWASFFVLPPERCTFASPNELADFLAAVAQNKVIEEFRRKMLGAKENLNRLKSLEDMDPAVCD